MLNVLEYLNLVLKYNVLVTDNSTNQGEHITIAISH